MYAELKHAQGCQLGSLSNRHTQAGQGSTASVKLCSGDADLLQDGMYRLGGAMHWARTS